MDLVAAALLVWTTVVAAQVDPPQHDAVAALKGLIARRLGPTYVSQISLGTLPASSTGLDVAQVHANDGKIVLEGSSATAMAYGLHTYLKQVVKTQADWEDHALHLPRVLPLPSKPIRLEKQSKYTYYQNVCTASYSAWTWSWSKWEKHLDWMALNGINMPLAFTGQEKVWQATFARFNITSLDNFFAGAAFLAWGRMGNIQGSWVRGPLPQSFIDDQAQLQHEILNRMKEFGMMPALPAFAGHIPAEFVKLYPAAKVIQSDAWAGFQPPFTKVYLMDPTDPMFLEIGAAFLDEYQAEYGFTAHLYQADTYNEMDPRDSSAAYLKQASSAVLKSMQMVDPKAVWLMQGWLFSFSRFWTEATMEAYLSPLPIDSLIVLDLYAEVLPQWKKSHNFFNHAWIYCVLHNFGGSLGMRGDLPTLAEAPTVARRESQGRMVGVGLTMEGIFQNYIVYDLTLTMAWTSRALVVKTYVEEFVAARYAGGNAAVQAAWKALASSVYNVRNAFGGVTKDIVCLRPRWNLIHDGFMPTRPFHDPKDVRSAWKELLKAPLPHVEAYLHDLVDVTRQAMSDGILAQYKLIQTQHDRRSATLPEMETLLEGLLERMADLDLILSTSVDFMLGTWLHDARALARADRADDDADYFEYEARNQVTRWGDNNFNTLTDYAGKEWSGLVSSYYIPRWKIWTDQVLKAYKEERSVDSRAVVDAIEAFELQWQLETTRFPTTPQGDSIAVSRQLYVKYVDPIADGLPPPLPESKALNLQQATVKDTTRRKIDMTEWVQFCLADCLW
ncbi:unnamed protein product [Aphanomyces euteiches]